MAPVPGCCARSPCCWPLGCGLPDCELVVPVLVDPDTQNGDVRRTVDLLLRYARLHQALHADGRPTRQEGFFNQPLATLRQLNTARGRRATRLVRVRLWRY
ncbi:MAG: hypothetical protein WKG07_23335 [Hymenobacter sp.]